MNDTLKEYLKSELKDILFSELDKEFLEGSGLAFLAGVPIPIKKSDLADFSKAGLNATKIADNMALVIGADTEFKYKDAYKRYLNKLFDNKLVLVFAKNAEKLIEKEEYRKAICYLRAGVLLQPAGKDAMYFYANGLRLWYQSLEGSDETELIGILKGEANNGFASLTNVHPDFAPGWYFLGFAYLNAGSYIKAELAFNHYLECTDSKTEDETKEVKERLEELKDPVIIENAKNLLIAGSFSDALKVFEPYSIGKYEKWWPIHYYIAVCYRQLGNLEKSSQSYLKLLSLNPSNADAMQELSEVYEKLGDEDKAKKYAQKAKIVLENMDDNIK